MTPVTEAVNSLDSAADFEFPAPGSVGYDEFRKTGKLPSTETSAPPKDEKEAVQEVTQDQEQETSSAEEASAASESVIAAASEAARPQKGKKQTAEERKAQLSSEIRESVKQAAELRKQIEEMRSTLSAPRETKQEAQPATDKAEVKAGEFRPKPKLGDKVDGQPVFKTWEEFEDARDAWVAEKAVADALGKFTERSTKTQQEAKAAEAQKTVDEAWGVKVAKAREKYPDFDAVMSSLQTAKDRHGKEFFIARGGAIDQFLQESPHGADVFHYVASHANEEQVQRIFERSLDGKYFTMTAIQQVLELSAIAQQFKTPPVTPKAPPAKPITQAPPPPHQVSGKSAAPDALEQAVKDGDQAAYTRLENDKAVARWKAGRRGK